MDQTIDASQITGYAAEDRYLATRYTQGARVVFDFELPLVAIPMIFPVPDPDHPTVGNRKVKASHARDFGNYVREHEDWVSPALLMRADNIFKFEQTAEVAGASFGVLGVPRAARHDIRIIDGQHRILGLHYAIEDIARELDEARDRVASARREDDKDQVAHFSRIINKLEAQRKRLASEFLAVQVHVETDPQAFEQMFYDVADNALGITGAVKVRFDSRKIMNRALDATLKHALLKDHVDIEQDRIAGQNPNLLGARHVVDLVRTVNLGIWSRVSKRQESELDEGTLVQRANEFFDMLLEAFPDLAAVADGTLSTPDLRQRSLLGSSTMLRVLGGVFYDLDKKGYSDEEIAELFTRLSVFMNAPLAADSPWLTIRSAVFQPGASAPTARAQDLRSLTEEISEWIDPRMQPGWLAEVSG